MTTITIEVCKPAYDGRVGLLCRNEATGEESWKIYKNMAEAKAAATRFEKSVPTSCYEIIRR